MQLSRVDFAIGEMTILGKGSKERKVPIGVRAKKALIDYISKERVESVDPRGEDRVFMNADGNPVTHDVVEKLFQLAKSSSTI